MYTDLLSRLHTHTLAYVKRGMLGAAQATYRFFFFVQL